MGKKIVIMLSVLAVVLFTCVASAVSAQAYTPAQRALNVKCHNLNGVHSFVNNRIYTVVMPTRVITAPIPMMVSIHGATGSMKGQAKASGLDKAAQTRNFIAVFPQARDSKSHVWDTSPDGVDMTYILGIINYMKSTGCVDVNRIYVSGFSQGGMLTSQLACHHPNLIAGAAPIGGIIPTFDCPKGKPVPVIAAHGTADPAVYYDGGFSPNVLMVTGTKYVSQVNRAQILKNWALRNKCASTIQTQKVGFTTTIVTYSCKDKPNVKEKMITVSGGIHIWFGNLNDNPKTSPVMLTSLVLEMFKL